MKSSEKERLTAEQVHRLASFVRYHYSKCESTFENHMRPIAFYDREGKIVMATKYFQEISDITPDEIERGEANIYNCLNGDLLVETARNSFTYDETIIYDFDTPLRTKTETAAWQAAAHIYAIFFPVTHIKGEVEYSGILLCEKTKTENENMESENQIITEPELCGDENYE